MGTIKVKKGEEWVKLPNYGIQVEEFPDAPADGKTYGRKNKQWSEIKANGVVLPQETQNNILNAINKIDYTNPSKTTVTPEEYNSIITAFDGKITPKDNVYYDVSYDVFDYNANIDIFHSIPIIGMKMVYQNNKTIIGNVYYNLASIYLPLSEQKGVSTGSLSISDASHGYSLRYYDATFIPVSSSDVSEISVLSQSQYDSLPTKDSETLYIIK